MEQDVLKFIFQYLLDLRIQNCDVYLNRPTIVGEKEQRSKSYVVASFPNGFEYLNAIAVADGMITIGAKDKILGLPNAGEITRISEIIKSKFPILNEDYSFIDFQFSSDDSNDVGWHEYYYSFQLYINKSN